MIVIIVLVDSTYFRCCGRAQSNMSAFTKKTQEGSFLPNSRVTSQTKLYTGSMLSPLYDGLVYEVNQERARWTFITPETLRFSLYL